MIAPFVNEKGVLNFKTLKRFTEAVCTHQYSLFTPNSEKAIDLILALPREKIKDPGTITKIAQFLTPEMSIDQRLSMIQEYAHL